METVCWTGLMGLGASERCGESIARSMLISMCRKVDSLPNEQDYTVLYLDITSINRDYWLPKLSLSFDFFSGPQTYDSRGQTDVKSEDFNMFDGYALNLDVKGRRVGSGVKSAGS